MLAILQWCLLVQKPMQQAHVQASLSCWPHPSAATAGVKFSMPHSLCWQLADQAVGVVLQLIEHLQEDHRTQTCRY